MVNGYPKMLWLNFLPWRLYYCITIKNVLKLIINYISQCITLLLGVSDSLEQNKLMKCEHYEVSGTTLFADCNGPKISRISKQKLVNI